MKTKYSNIDEPNKLINGLREIQSSPDTGSDFKPIFRGVADSSKHKLIPTAYREDSEWYFWKLAGVAGLGVKEEFRTKEFARVLGELEIIKKFLNIADSAGLPLPPVPIEFLDAIRTPIKLALDGRDSLWNEIVSNWPHRAFAPVIALAQHYGLPTRFLDWTYDPMIALYFAAQGGFKKNEIDKGGNSRIAIWVSFAGLFNALNHAKDVPARLGLVSPPLFQNPNLAAQKGVFTYIADKDTVGEDFSSRPLDEVVHEFLEGPVASDSLANIYLSGSDFTFIKVTFPQVQCAELLRVLNGMGYNQARLFPGYQGAADTLKTLAEIGSRIKTGK